MKKWTAVIICVLASVSALAATSQEPGGARKLSKPPSPALVQPIDRDILSDEQKLERSFSTPTRSKLAAVSRQFLLQNASLAPGTDVQGVVQREVLKAFANLGLSNMDVSEMAFWVMIQAAKAQHDDLKEILAQMKLAEERGRQIAKLRARAHARLGGYQSRSSAGPSPGVVSPRSGRPNQLNYTRNMRIAYSRVPEVGYTLKDVDTASLDQLGEMETALGAIGERAQLASIQLQSSLQRQQQMIQTLSNILKKQHDTLGAITGNIK